MLFLGATTFVKDVYLYHFNHTITPHTHTLSVPRSSFGCALNEETGKIIVAGGVSSNWQRLNSVEIFDLVTGVITLAENPIPSGGSKVDHITFWLTFTMPRSIVPTYELAASSLFTFRLSAEEQQARPIF